MPWTQPGFIRKAIFAATARDIIEALLRPGRDPREDLPPPIFKRGILKLEDLNQGMELRGTVLNVVDFGAFVDVGLKESGLVHISQLSTRFIRSPHDVVAVGQVVTAWVLSVDAERGRVSLTMIAPGTPKRVPQKSQPPRKERQPESRRVEKPEPLAAAEALPSTASPPPPPRPVPRAPAPARPHIRKARSQPAPPLSQGVLEGTEPARSFGELKRLWDARRKN
jgi:uncharacterized protein